VNATISTRYIKTLSSETFALYSSAGRGSVRGCGLLPRGCGGSRGHGKTYALYSSVGCDFLEDVVYSLVDVVAPMVMVSLIDVPIASGSTTLWINVGSFTVSRPGLHHFHYLRLVYA